MKTITHPVALLVIGCFIGTGIHAIYPGATVIGVGAALIGAAVMYLLLAVFRMHRTGGSK